MYGTATTTGPLSGRAFAARSSAPSRWQEIDTWLAESSEPDDRLETLVQTMREHLRLVVIDLEKHDDAQVVFETLNSRGTPLEHADLIKNLLFRDAEHANADVDRLYTTYWAPFDQDEWRTEQTTGRITRSRLDVFLTYWLTMRSLREFTASTLFKEFERWLLDSSVRTVSTEDVFGELARYAQIYDSIDQHLVRRAILNLSNRDYNHVFRELVGAATQHARLRGRAPGVTAVAWTAEELAPYAYRRPPHATSDRWRAVRWRRRPRALRDRDRPQRPDRQRTRLGGRSRSAGRRRSAGSARRTGCRPGPVGARHRGRPYLAADR
ncbi:DUF262 domain-containing protein [Streptomyces luteogriseus]